MGTSNGIFRLAVLANKRGANMKRNLLITAVAILGVSITASGQHALTHTQHGALRTVMNPASSLMHMDGEVNVVGRRQWLGMEGAPQVFWGSGHLGIQHFGATAGFQVRHESLALERLTEASAFFAKRVRISAIEYVGLSLNAGIGYLDGRFSQLDPMDPAFREDVKETDALIGFGVMLYRPNHYYVGLSLPRLMLGSLGVGSEHRYNFRNQYHLTAGALFALSTDFQFRPSLLVTYADNLRPQVDISALVFIKDVFGIGMNLRSYGDIAAMAQVNFGGVGLGYSYQFNPSDEPLNRRIGNNTHEIGINYRFGGVSDLL